MIAKSPILREEQPGDGGSSGSGDKGRKIVMDDGRVLNFGEKTRMKKDYGVDEAGNVFARIDFDNGKTVLLLVDPTSQIGLIACGHGLSQKLGDAAAGATSTEDAFEAILEVAARINKGEWKKASEGGGESAKGASELVTALAEYLKQSKEETREMLAGLNAGDKAALRKLDEVNTIIVRLRAEREPSKAEKEKAEKANALLQAMMRGEKPVSEAPAGGSE